MTELAILLLAIPVFWAFSEWRLGLLLCLATAILQDPLRKLAPGQPAYFIVFVGIVFAAACLGAQSRGVPLTPRSIFGGNKSIITPMTVLLLLIVLEAFNSFFRFGNPIVTLLGLLTYLLPLPAIVFAYQLVLRAGEARIHQFMKAYVLFTMLALITIYLEYIGYDWPVLGSVGPKLLIYDRVIGVPIALKSGIFRASEIAAWHAMTCACFILLLTTVRKINVQTLLTAAIIIVLLLGVAALTGRRKAVVEVAIFAGVYLILWAVFQRNMAKTGLALAIVGGMGFIWWAAQVGTDYVGEGSLSYLNYVERSKTVFVDVPSRFVELGIAPIMWAYDRFGFLGAGVGVGTQGAQHFLQVGTVIGGAGEGGLGRIALELGVPGLLVLGWLAIAVFSHMWRIIRASSQISPRIARLSYGLFGFLVANMAAFSVATQAYSDLFVLLILSWTLGFLFAVPVLLEREVRARQPVIFEDVAPAFQPKTV